MNFAIVLSELQLRHVSGDISEISKIDDSVNFAKIVSSGATIFSQPRFAWNRAGRKKELICTGIDLVAVFLQVKYQYLETDVFCHPAILMTYYDDGSIRYFDGKIGGFGYNFSADIKKSKIVNPRDIKDGITGRHGWDNLPCFQELKLDDLLRAGIDIESADKLLRS